MIFSTFYFSGTGNTKWVAGQFCGIAGSSGNLGRLYSIDACDQMTDDELRTILNASDYIGFANPIYGADIPPIMKTFIRRLTDIQRTEKNGSKPAYLINTFGYINACGPIAACRLLDKVCFRLMAYVNIKMCGNISTYKMKSDFVSAAILSKRKARAKAQLEVLINRLSAGKKHIKGIGPYLIPGILIRKRAGPAVRSHYKELGVRTDTCVGCMACVRNCPTHSIRFINDRFQFSEGCTACSRCYNFCPTFSITLGGIYADPSVYRRFRGPDSLL
jgi:NAD-dependent dihydropyrimidine dehydrogenase PreA subunit